VKDSNWTSDGFTIERLRTFCRIAEAGSITLAAKGDLNRQSQFSRQVKELEEFFGAKLLERAGKSVRLTDAGRKLALITQSFFLEIDALRAVESLDNVVRIGAGESVLRWLLMPRFTEMKSLAPGVRFEFRTRNTAQSVEDVKTGKVDFAIVRKDAAEDSMTALPCASMQYAFVVPRKLLPGRTAAGLHLLPTIPFALLTGDGVLAKRIVTWAAKEGVNLDIHVKAENFSLLLSSIENADLAAVLPVAAAASLSKERFATVQIDRIETLTRELVLVYSPHAAELREVIRRLAPRLSSLLAGGR
jgi:DNA-binding transcriptional LysR family regulator